MEHFAKKLSLESVLNLELKLKIGVSCKTKTKVHDVMSCSWRVGWPMEEDRLTEKITYSSAAAVDASPSPMCAFKWLAREDS